MWQSTRAQSTCSMPCASCSSVRVLWRPDRRDLALHSSGIVVSRRRSRLPSEQSALSQLSNDWAQRDPQAVDPQANNFQNATTGDYGANTPHEIDDKTVSP